MLAFLVFLLGLLIGSFLNVCIYRIPKGESVVFPASHCPQCLRQLGPLDLVPVLSYLWLKGRCRSCRAKISPSYALIELFTGLVFWLVYSQTGLTPQLINYLLLSSILVVVTFIDLEHYLIPNKVLAVGALLQLAVNLFTQQISLFDAFVGCLTGGGLLLLIAVASKGGMGGGDVKLAAMLGLFLGWQKVLLAFFIAAILGAVAGLILMALKGKGRKDALPFGPFLAMGAMVTLLWGQQLLDWYLGLYF